MNEAELKDLDKILKIAAKWDTEEIIESEKGSLWVNITSACLLIKEELKRGA